jgi:predicted GNAT superfamily acetyltransferase
MANWSNKLPTKEGYYWARRKGSNAAAIVHVTKDPSFSSGLVVWFFGNEQEEDINSPSFVNFLWKEVR